MTSPDFGSLIVAVARTRDREAFALLFAHFAPRLKSFLIRSGADPAAAEDFAQEAMLAVWHKAALFDPARAGASSWIFTIARNLRIDTLRRERRAISETDPSQQPDTPLQPDAAFDEQEDAARIRKALSCLSDDQKAVVHLSYFHDLAHPEISTALGLPLGTVKSRLRLAMVRLREALGDAS